MISLVIQTPGLRSWESKRFYKEALTKRVTHRIPKMQKADKLQSWSLSWAGSWKRTCVCGSALPEWLTPPSAIFCLFCTFKIPKPVVKIVQHKTHGQRSNTYFEKKDTGGRKYKNRWWLITLWLKARRLFEKPVIKPRSSHWFPPTAF